MQEDLNDSFRAKGENSRNSCTGRLFLKCPATPLPSHYPTAPTYIPPPHEAPPVTPAHRLVPSSPLYLICLCQQMPASPVGPTLPALVVLGHLVTLIVFWHVRNHKRKGKRAMQLF